MKTVEKYQKILIPTSSIEECEDVHFIVIPVVEELSEPKKILKVILKNIAQYVEMNFIQKKST